jgi:hypothetical protein
MSKSNEENVFYVNHDRVMKTKEYVAATRLLAMHFKENQYLSVEDFLLDLSNNDLKILMEKVDKNDLEEIILLAEMLATGEGLENSGNEEQITARTNTFSGFLIVESLARKGMVKVYRENMSFGEDFAKKIIVEKL